MTTLCQMEIFNFLWLNWVQYLPLAPTQADEHFAPKHILLLRNTLLLKSITHFAAQHTWQSHNLLFYTPCS